VIAALSLLWCSWQVRRAQQLLACYRAVAALRSDETFQEDASEPHVQAALQDMGLHNNVDKYGQSELRPSCCCTEIKHASASCLQDEAVQ